MRYDNIQWYISYLQLSYPHMISIGIHPIPKRSMGSDGAPPIALERAVFRQDQIERIVKEVDTNGDGSLDR